MSKSMQYRIMSESRDGSAVERKIVDISLPRSNGEARKVGTDENSRLKAALRMYGCRAIHSANGDVYAVGSRSGKRIWAEPVNAVKVNKRNKQDAPTIPAVTEKAPFGIKKDGTPAKKRGRKPQTEKVNNSVPANFDPTIHAVDANGQPVFKLDGTLAKKRGRKPVAQSAPQSAPVVTLTKKQAKKVIAGLVSGETAADDPRVAAAVALLS
jgi:hypothetical protein